MKKLLYILFVFLLSGPLISQVSNNTIIPKGVKPKAQYIPPGKIKNLFPKFPRVQLIEEYEMPQRNAMHIKMDYGKYKILNPADWKNGLADKKPRVIELVMTLHPSSTKKWRDDYFKLIGNRMKKLYALDSIFLLDEDIFWKISLQTKAKKSSSAKKMFHGIVIHYTPLKDKESVNNYMSSLHRSRKKRYTAMTEVDKLNKILDRLTKKYKNMLIITDCTSSMEPYGAEVALWHLLQDTSASVRNFVFFNDGDGIPTKQKVLGETGGIHFADPKHPQEVINTIRMVNVMGKGNDDGPENDAEAVLRAMDGTPDFDEIVLIVDNNSDIRDIELLEKLDRPIRIVLCGVGQKGMNFDYIKLAFHTKGTLHTVEEDITILVKAKEGDKFKLDGYRYEIVNGKIVCLNINKGL